MGFNILRANAIAIIFLVIFGVLQTNCATVPEKGTEVTEPIPVTESVTKEPGNKDQCSPGGYPCTPQRPDDEYKLNGTVHGGHIPCCNGACLYEPGWIDAVYGTEPWIVYHALEKPDAGWTGRTARVQKFGWNPDNSPAFPRPLGFGVALDTHSGE